MSLFNRGFPASTVESGCASKDDDAVAFNNGTSGVAALQRVGGLPGRV